MPNPPKKLTASQRKLQDYKRKLADQTKLARDANRYSPFKISDQTAVATKSHRNFLVPAHKPNLTKMDALRLKLKVNLGILPTMTAEKILQKLRLGQTQHFIKNHIGLSKLTTEEIQEIADYLLETEILPSEATPSKILTNTILQKLSVSGADTETQLLYRQRLIPSSQPPPGFIPDPPVVIPTPSSLPPQENPTPEEPTPPTPQPTPTITQPSQPVVPALVPVQPAAAPPPPIPSGRGLSSGRWSKSGLSGRSRPLGRGRGRGGAAPQPGRPTQSVPPPAPPVVAVPLQPEPPQAEEDDDSTDESESEEEEEVEPIVTPVTQVPASVTFDPQSFPEFGFPAGSRPSQEEAEKWLNRYVENCIINNKVPVHAEMYAFQNHLDPSLAPGLVNFFLNKSLQIFDADKRAFNYSLGFEPKTTQKLFAASWHQEQQISLKDPSPSEYLRDYRVSLDQVSKWNIGPPNQTRRERLVLVGYHVRAIRLLEILVNLSENQRLAAVTPNNGYFPPGFT